MFEKVSDKLKEISVRFLHGLKEKEKIKSVVGRSGKGDFK